MSPMGATGKGKASPMMSMGAAMGSKVMAACVRSTSQGLTLIHVGAQLEQLQDTFMS